MIAYFLQIFLLELERSFGEPPTLIKNDPKGRYGWRVNGGNGYYPRVNTVEDVYEKQWQYHSPDEVRELIDPAYERFLNKKAR